MRPLLRLVLALAAVTVAAPLAAQGRPIGVGTQRIRDLVAGTVIPGVPLTIAPSDPTRSAQLSVTGIKLAQVECSFTLPASLGGPAGAVMPIAFDASSAATTLTGTTADLVARDPRVSFTANLSDKGRLFVYVGANLQPVSGQRPGAYSTALSLTCAYTGL